MKDLPLAQYISQLLGGVQIRMKIKENACVLTVNSLPKVVLLAYLLNGLFRSPKIIQFELLLTWLKTNGYVDINNLGVDMSDMTKNGWLAGFIDADGSFKIRTTPEVVKKNIDTGQIITKKRIACSLSIEQRKESNSVSYLPLMSCIATVLGATVKVSMHNNIEYFFVTATSMLQLKKAIDYFDRYQLLSSKYLDYCNWKTAYVLMLDKQHLTEAGVKTIKELKASMNKKRSVFTWDHLNHTG